MFMKFLLVLTLAACFLSGCNKKPTINPEIAIDTTAAVDDRFSDTTKALVASLPIKFDSTDVTLFAVSFVELESNRGLIKSEYGSSYSSGSSFFSSGNDYVDGSFVNLIFQLKNGETRKLTEMKANFDQVNFLREVYKKTGVGYLIYFVYDRDTNGDREYDSQDLRALYISKLDGSDFKKISQELHDFHDYEFIEDEMRWYFRTLEDRDNDGMLTKQDTFHHYYISFTFNGYTVTEFNPLEIFEK